MIVEYARTLGKYEHEVYEQATIEDIQNFIALNNIEWEEQKRADSRAKALAKAHKH